MRDTTTTKTSTAAVLHSGVTVTHEPTGPSAAVQGFVPTLVAILLIILLVLAFLRLPNIWRS